MNRSVNFRPVYYGFIKTTVIISLYKCSNNGQKFTLPARQKLPAFARDLKQFHHAAAISLCEQERQRNFRYGKSER